jgi:hypothetical protein
MQMHIAACKGNLSAVKALPHVAHTQMHIAACEGNLTAVKVLIEEGGATIDFADRWWVVVAAVVHLQPCSGACQGKCRREAPVRPLTLRIGVSCTSESVQR